MKSLSERAGLGLVLVLCLGVLGAEGHCLSGGWSRDRVLLYGSVAADFASTRAVIARGGQEVNPVLGQGVVRQVAVMGASAVAVDCLAGVLDRRRPGSGGWLRRVAGYGHFGLAGWNLGLVVRW